VVVLGLLVYDVETDRQTDGRTDWQDLYRSLHDISGKIISLTH